MSTAASVREEAAEREDEAAAQHVAHEREEQRIARQNGNEKATKTGAANAT